jgi:hypothetical protein
MWMALDCVNLLRNTLAAGAPLESGLATLREQGGTIIESIRAVREVQSVPLGEAKRIVAQSATWDDHRDNHDRMIAEILGAIEDDAGDPPA